MLLLMAGFAGTGKTTLANWLFDRLRELNLDWEILIKDKFKREHLELQEDVKLAGHNAYDDLFTIVEQEVLTKRKSCIIDTSNEHTFILNTIQEALKKTEHYHVQPYHIKVIFCVADKETRTKRLKARGSEFKPYNTELPLIRDDKELVELFSHILDNASLPEKFNSAHGIVSIEHISKGLIINTTPTLDEYAQDVFSKIEIMLKETNIIR